jgi:hypothetical protein
MSTPATASKNGLNEEINSLESDTKNKNVEGLPNKHSAHTKNTENKTEQNSLSGSAGLVAVWRRR